MPLPHIFANLPAGNIPASYLDDNFSVGGMFTPLGTGAAPTVVQSKLQESVSVLGFYANGASGVTVDPTGVVDSYLGIQAALNYAAGKYKVYIPGGIYKVGSPITLPNYTYLYGDTGTYASSVLLGAGSSIFTYASLTHCYFDSVTFGASENGCTAFKQTTDFAYTDNTVWHNCSFLMSLSDCIYGNLILCKIDVNTFGFQGGYVSGQTVHHHITSTGRNGFDSNLNFLLRNKFYGAKGQVESVRFEYGRGLYMEGNDWEANNVSGSPVRALTILGMFNSDLRWNWFENTDNGTEVIYLGNSETVNSGNYNVTINHNFFSPIASCTNILTCVGNTTVAEFDNNYGAGSGFGYVCSNSGNPIWSAKNLTWGAGTLPVNPCEGSFSPSLTSQNGSITTSLSGQVHTYSTMNNMCDFNISLTVQSVSSPTGSLFITGMPFAAVSDTPVMVIPRELTSNTATEIKGYIAAGTTNLYIEGYTNGNLAYGGDFAPFVNGNTNFCISGRYKH